MPEHDIVRGSFKDSGGGLYVFPWCAGSVSCRGLSGFSEEVYNTLYLNIYMWSTNPCTCHWAERRSDSTRRHTAKIRGGMGERRRRRLASVSCTAPSVGVLLGDGKSLFVGVSPHHVFSCTLLFVVAVIGYTLATIPSLSCGAVVRAFGRSCLLCFRAVVAHALRLAYSIIVYDAY